MNNKCNICGKNLSSPNKTNTIKGISVVLRTDTPDIDPEYKKFLEEQIAPFRSNVEYSACLGCYLLSLGIKPETEWEIANEKD